MIKSISMLLAGISLGGFLNIAAAGSLTIPNTFTAGTKAVAADVNGDFTAVKTAVNDNDTRIAKLEATITTLQASLKKVNGNTVLDLDKVLVYTTDANGHPTAQFTGVNVQVVNGTGLETKNNGLGNLIVGYNHPRTSSKVCSDGQYTTPSTCTTGGGAWAKSFKSGSHNLVVGNHNSYSQYGGVVFGDQNVINGIEAVVSGGQFNTASGEGSSVSSGLYNTASGSYSSVSGGSYSSANGQSSSVSGGNSNTASGSYSSVSGGRGNTANGQSSSISGGDSNTTSANGDYSSVLGGLGENAFTADQTIPQLP